MVKFHTRDMHKVIRTDTVGVLVCEEQRHSKFGNNREISEKMVSFEDKKCRVTF